MARAKKTQDNNEASLARHAQADAALQEPVETASASSAKGLTLLGKLGVFIGFPLIIGLVGLYTSFLEIAKNKERELSFDRDFVLPFLLALAMVSVIGFQTGGYSQNEVQPLVSWPKVKRVKKIVYKNKKGEIISPTNAKQDFDSTAVKKDN
jgi:hypothetical protein